MKSIKFLFAAFAFTMLLSACSATSVSDDDQLYSMEEAQATGDDGTSEVMRNRD